MEPTAEEVAADSDRRARTRRKPGADLLQARHQLAAVYCRANRSRHRRSVDVDVTHPRQVDQQPAVTHAVANPAMAAGTNPDLQPLLLCQSHHRYDVASLSG